MGDILSQEEIDRLLNAMNSGELDENELNTKEEVQVKNYDFARPSKFSKEHLRTLEIIFEHYSRLLSTNLPAYLRKNVDIEVTNSEAVTYSEFTNSLMNPVILGIVDFSPLDGNIVIEIGSNIGYTIVDRMLGGEGNPLDKSRDFSEIEIVILERILNISVDLLREPWQNVIDLRPRLEKIETNSQFAQIIPPTEMIAIVTMNIKIGNVEGLINICLPYQVLEDVIDKLNTKYAYSQLSEKDSENYEEFLKTSLNKAKIPLKTLLGKTYISVNDFMNLAMGDIIKLNTKIEDELDVYVGNIRKFKALPGLSDDVYAARVTSIIKDENKEDE